MLEYGKRYRARNGTVFLLENVPTSYYFERPFLDEHIYCAKKGAFSWKPNGRYSAANMEAPHDLDLVEEVEEAPLSDLEKAQHYLDILVGEEQDKELDEPVVVTMTKRELMFLVGLVGNTNPQKALLQVRSTYCRELREDKNWATFYDRLSFQYPCDIFVKLLLLLKRTQ